MISRNATLSILIFTSLLCQFLVQGEFLDRPRAKSRLAGETEDIVVTGRGPLHAARQIKANENRNIPHRGNAEYDMRDNYASAADDVEYVADMAGEAFPGYGEDGYDSVLQTSSEYGETDVEDDEEADEFMFPHIGCTSIQLIAPDRLQKSNPYLVSRYIKVWDPRDEVNMNELHRPTYRHESGNAYLFPLVENHAKADQQIVRKWLVGDVAGKNSAWLLAVDHAADPTLLNSRWMVSYDDEENWIEEPELRFVCEHLKPEQRLRQTGGPSVSATLLSRKPFILETQPLLLPTEVRDFLKLVSQQQAVLTGAARQIEPQALNPQGISGQPNTRLQLPTNHELVKMISSRVATLFDVALTQMEPVQVHIYNVSQYGDADVDWYDLRPKAAPRRPSNKHLRVTPPADYLNYIQHTGGQRIASAMVFLQAASIGGETIFSHEAVHLGSAGRAGSALLWRNLNGEGHTDPEVIHEITEVRGGSLIFLKLQIRERAAQNGYWEDATADGEGYADRKANVMSGEDDKQQGEEDEDDEGDENDYYDEDEDEEDDEDDYEDDEDTYYEGNIVD